jgi:AcrR family transcriptional regulator
VSRSPAARRKGAPYHHGDLKNALIAAGADILSKDGVAGLSLRKVAHKAGVSHAAPYAHFADKQALIAAISTDGYRRLYDAIRAAAERHRGNPERQLVEGAWAYVKFALDDPGHFKVTMSGIVEKEQEYPAFVQMSQKTFALVREIVRACQAHGVLRPGPPDLAAVGVWSLMHGLISLLLENLISRRIRERLSVRGMLIATLNQITSVRLDARVLGSSPRDLEITAARSCPSGRQGTHTSRRARRRDLPRTS